MKHSPFPAAKKRNAGRLQMLGPRPGRGLARYLLMAIVPWAIAGTDISATPSGRNHSLPRRVPDTPHPAVVRIIVPEGRSTSLGSGTLVAVNDRHGLVLTNWHVIRDARDRIEVAFPDGFRSQATLLAADRDWDLAALAIWRPNVQPMLLANQAPWPGELLTIAGYGSGRYRTATGRCMQYVSPGTDLPFEMVELAAGAREGDSGGPILNQQGELAGVLFGATWGRTAGSHTVAVRRFLASVADRFAALPEAPATLAQLPQSVGNRSGQPVEAQVHRINGDSRPSGLEPDVIAARPSSRIASDASAPSTALNVDGWAAARRARVLAKPDTPQIPPSVHPNTGNASDSKVPGRETKIFQSSQWQTILGSTPGGQLKTLLAAIGLFSILLHGWRMLGKA